jgi:hypothetical protein
MVKLDGPTRAKVGAGAEDRAKETARKVGVPGCASTGVCSAVGFASWSLGEDGFVRC